MAAASAGRGASASSSVRPKPGGGAISPTPTVPASVTTSTMAPSRASSVPCAVAIGRRKGTRYGCQRRSAMVMGMDAMRRLWILEDFMAADATPAHMRLPWLAGRPIVERRAPAAAPGHLEDARMALDSLDPEAGTQLSAPEIDDKLLHS